MAKDAQIFLYLGMSQIMPVANLPTLECLKDDPYFFKIGNLMKMIPVFDSQENPSLFGLFVQLFQAQKDRIQIFQVHGLPGASLRINESQRFLFVQFAAVV